MRMRKMAVVMMVVLAACGSDSDGGNSGDSGDGKDGKAPVTLAGAVNDHGSKDATGKSGLEVEADDFYFGPSFIKAAAGQSLKLELHNEGTTPHTFTVEGGVDEELAPDATKTVTVTAPASGVLVYFCRFHRSQGMQGAVYLREGDTAATTSSTAPATSSSSGAYGY